MPGRGGFVLQNRGAAPVGLFCKTEVPPPVGLFCQIEVPPPVGLFCQIEVPRTVGLCCQNRRNGTIDLAMDPQASIAANVPLYQNIPISQGK